MPEVFDLGRVAGPQGPPGPTGETGPEGAPGPQGDLGEQGAAGLSAYETAVQEGFTGTEAEYRELLANVGNIPVALAMILGE
jgi:hypothetical protein